MLCIYHREGWVPKQLLFDSCVVSWGTELFSILSVLFSPRRGGAPHRKTNEAKSPLFDAMKFHVAWFYNGGTGRRQQVA